MGRDEYSFPIIEATASGMENEVLACEKAREVGEALSGAYPDHLWMVGWQGGVLIVKNMAISTMYGMVIKYIGADQKTAKELKKEAIKHGGELLERAGMKRGKWDGSFATSLQGSEPRFFKPTVN